MLGVKSLGAGLSFGSIVHRNNIMNRPKQSPEILNLKAYLERTKGVQLPPVQAWQNPHKITVQSTKEVRGWGDDD